jgi:energy-coupling factor transporter ATP-binding protein EcfA2
LKAVGLAARADHYPSQLSGGEQQRVALARAAVSRPAILLADEPTGNLDGANGAAIMDLLFGLRDRHGATLVLVTHAPDLAARCDRVVRLADGRVQGDARIPGAVAVLVRLLVKRPELIAVIEDVERPADLSTFGRVNGKVNYRLALQQAYRFACTGEEPDPVPAGGAPTPPAGLLTPAQKAWVTRRARAAAAGPPGTSPGASRARRQAARKSLRR